MLRTRISVGTVLLLLGTVGAGTGRLASPSRAATATVDLSSPNGQPKHLASGVLYGIPDRVPNPIPDKFFNGMGLNYCRVGGAQLTAPKRGWTHGFEEYRGRLESSRLDYLQCRRFGAPGVLLIHDVWGTDSVDTNAHWPGDGGDWSDFDRYIKQLLDDLVAYNMLDGLVLDIWNEPDMMVFWPKRLGIQRWVDLYIRTHRAIRADKRFAAVKISGPSLATRPREDNPWWTTWLPQIAEHQTVPDQWSYHLEGRETEVDNDPRFTSASLRQLLTKYGLPERETNINEYAQFNEQVPAGLAWWIARLERYNFIGLLGNWQLGTMLHDLLANLLTKTKNPADYSATDYTPAPGYWVYNYYVKNMTGQRLKTEGSSDAWLDVYATRDEHSVRLLVGSKIKAGTWAIRLDKLSAVGYAGHSDVAITTHSFDGTDLLKPQGPPSFRNVVKHDISADSVTFPIYQTDAHTAWAFEFPVF